METRIIAAEEEIDLLRTEMDSAEVSSDHEKLQHVYEARNAAQKTLDELFARWEELEQKIVGK